MNTKKVIIIGAGFGGIQAAQKLARLTNSQQLEIVIVSDRDHFEYYPGLHTYLSIQGNVPYTSIPLEDLFSDRVQVIRGKVTSCDLVGKKITLESGDQLTADYIVLAVGSQSTFFNIEGLPTMSFPFQTVDNALRLRSHIETLFSKHCVGHDVADCVVGLHFVIVGAGPNGVDLAGELATFTKHLCKKHNIQESLVTIDLIDGAGTILPMMSSEVQVIATRRLRMLGVNILCNRQLLKQGSWTVALADMTLGAKTLIWTAGTTGNALVNSIASITVQKKNKILVTHELEIENNENCFAVGDIADTPYSGLAQTAIHDGNYVARVIASRIMGKKITPYSALPVAYNIGVGHGWSITQVRGMVISGKISSWLRKIIDLKYFLSILPISKVWMLSPFKK